MFDCKEGADEVHAEDLRPVLGGLLRNRGPAAGNAGVCKDHVEPALLPRDLLDQRMHLGLAAGVDLRVSAIAYVRADDRSAFAAEQRDSGLADAGRGAGHDRDFA